MFVQVIQIFVISFFFNLLWEMLHSCLYDTCLHRAHAQNVRAITVMSVRDAFWIVFFYMVSVLVFGSWQIFESVWQVLVFVALTMVFAAIDEVYSLRKGRWKYSTAMPTVFGVGLTPLIELGVTGLLALFIVL